MKNKGNNILNKYIIIFLKIIYQYIDLITDIYILIEVNNV